MITFWAKLRKIRTGTREQDTAQNSNRHQSMLRCCRDVKQVLTPSEWFRNFRVHTKADAIADIISR